MWNCGTYIGIGNGHFRGAAAETGADWGKKGYREYAVSGALSLTLPSLPPLFPSLSWLNIPQIQLGISGAVSSPQRGPGLRPGRPRWGSLQRSSDPLARFKGPNNNNNNNNNNSFIVYSSHKSNWIYIKQKKIRIRKCQILHTAHMLKC